MAKAKLGMFVARCAYFVDDHLHHLVL